MRVRYACVRVMCVCDACARFLLSGGCVLLFTCWNKCCCNEYCLNENKKIEALNICWNECCFNE